MKILVAGNYYYPEHLGGVETVSFNLVKHYRRAGHQVRWLAADVPPHYRAVQPGDVPVRSWNITEERLGFPHPIPNPGAVVKVAESVRWCDVVHLQDCLYSTNVLTFAIARALHRPVLITQYAKLIPYSQAYKRLLQSACYATIGHWMFSATDRLVFITKNVRDGMGYVNPRKQYGVLPLGVDTDIYRPISDEERRAIRSRYTCDPSKPLILFVGRMVERKGVGLFRALIPAHPEWNWVMVGRPDDYDPAAWSAPNLAYRARLEQGELSELFASADLLLHPTKGEGLTLTVSESMATGTPAVISKESLYEVRAGDRLLFRAVDLESGSIEVGIKSLVTMSPMKAKRLRNACRRFAERRYSWQSVSDQYLTLLSETLQLSHQG